MYLGAYRLSPPLKKSDDFNLVSHTLLGCLFQRFCRCFGSPDLLREGVNLVSERLNGLADYLLHGLCKLPVFRCDLLHRGIE